MIHCYTKSSFDKDCPPENSYITDNIDNVLSCIKDLLNNHNSGISNIVIENDEFTINCCNPLDLD